MFKDPSPKLKKKSEKFRTKTYYCKLKKIKIPRNTSKQLPHITNIPKRTRTPCKNQFVNKFSATANELVKRPH